MAIKRSVKRYCQHCGADRLHVNRRGEVWISHNCAQGPPGPPSPPTKFDPRHMVADGWAVEDLQREEPPR